MPLSNGSLSVSHLHAITQSPPIDVWPVERDDNLDRRRRHAPHAACGSYRLGMTRVARQGSRESRGRDGDTLTRDHDDLIYDGDDELYHDDRAVGRINTASPGSLTFSFSSLPSLHR
jgi:hypothetical protein